MQMREGKQLADVQWNAQHLSFASLLDNDGRFTPHPIAQPRQLALGQLDQAAALARSDLGDHRVGHPRRRRAVEHDPGDAGRPARGVPLQLDQHEGVARKQGRRGLDPAPMGNAVLAQAGQVDGVARQGEGM